MIQNSILKLFICCLYIIQADEDSVSKTLSFVPLKDVSIHDITVILNNLKFSALVDPFLTNGVSGKAISRIKSFQSIVDIGNGRISEFVAETFYEDFVVEWKSTGLVPKDLLQPKVSQQATVYSAMNVWLYSAHHHAGPVSIERKYPIADSHRSSLSIE